MSGASIKVSADWIEREQTPLPPSPRLAPFAPKVTFLEVMELESPEMHSALRIATTTNPFLRGDEVALDAQMHEAAGSANGLASYLIYFFSSPPRDCLDGGSEAYKKAKNHAELPDRTAISPDLSVRTDCKHTPTLTGFLLAAVEPRRTLSSQQWSGARERDFFAVLSGADGKGRGKRADVLRV